MKKLAKLTIAIAMFATQVFENVAAAQAPVQAYLLDTSFGVGGIVKGDFLEPITVHVYPDGSPLAVVDIAPTITEVTAGLARYTPSGALDVTFGVSGTFVLTPELQHVPLMDKGLLLYIQYADAIKIRRLDSSGNLSASFGISGEISWPPAGLATPNKPAGPLQSVNEDALGRLYLIGSAGTLTQSQYFVTRYTSTGQIDASYGVSGSALLQIPVDKFLHAKNGEVFSYDGINDVGGSRAELTDIVLRKLTATGQPDSAFGANGVVTVSRQSSTGSLGRIFALQPDGGILYSDDTVTPVGRGFDIKPRILRRLKPDGSADTAFGVQGVATLPTDTYRLVHIGSDGKIVLSRDLGTTSGYEQLFRLNPNGSLDTSFSQHGLRIAKHRSAIAEVGGKSYVYAVVESNKELHRYALTNVVGTVSLPVIGR